MKNWGSRLDDAFRPKNRPSLRDTKVDDRVWLLGSDKSMDQLVRDRLFMPVPAVVWLVDGYS